MRKMSVREVRNHLSEVIHEAEGGGVTTITRYGKPVAHIVPAETQPPTFPDMSAFRAQIGVRGKTLTQTLCEMRKEERL